ncbi:Universal stress protein family protein [Trujillonella endophytica]|uniref:Universal stress protein family protein n=1 Tax=Trujillonella endophytica TaxID=673521 RepID=A0A1H8UFS1_9ACTN|nr:Universal stress protein family protein [Trujillella endophytica]
MDVDGSPSAYRSLVWALHEAARREATVVAACVLDDRDGLPSAAATAAARARVDAQVLRAIGETGVHGRVRTAALERPVFDALSGAARGGDLVLVTGTGKRLLRPAVPRPPARRLARGA